jgi:hypothetical protein
MDSIKKLYELIEKYIFNFPTRWENYSSVYRKVNVNGLTLRFAHLAFKDNFDIVQRAMRDNLHALQYASSRMKADRALIEEAIYIYGDIAFEYADKKFRSDKEMIMHALTGRGINYKGKMVYPNKAIKNWGYSALKYASEEIRNDKEVVLYAFSNNAPIRLSDLYNDIGDELKSDKNFSIYLLNENYDLYSCFSPELQADKDVVVAARHRRRMKKTFPEAVTGC